MSEIKAILNHGDEVDIANSSQNDLPVKPNLPDITTQPITTTPEHRHIKQFHLHEPKQELSHAPNPSSQQKYNINLPKHLPQPKINKELLNKELVNIAIRRKSIHSVINNNSINSKNSSKLHIKSLEAGLRVKLILAPNLITLYNSLTPHNNRQSRLYVFNLNHEIHGDIIHNTNYLQDVKLSAKSVQLIDHNLVNISVFSNKVLKSLNNHNVKNLPIFNSLNTAVHSLFDINEYSLVRITRSTINDFEGSQLLKLETAKPGELSLIDDDEYLDDYLNSIGSLEDEFPSNLFIKKIVARPRYKSDMKIYLIPKNYHSSLYIDKRMFERDLINGVIDLPFYKNIYCTFEFDESFNNFKQLVKLSQAELSIKPTIEQPNNSSNYSSTNDGSVASISAPNTPMIEDSVLHHIMIPPISSRSLPGALPHPRERTIVPSIDSEKIPSVHTLPLSPSILEYFSKESYFPSSVENESNHLCNSIPLGDENDEIL